VSTLKRVAVRDALYTIASRAPTANDDNRTGAILIGSRWIHGTDEYRCDMDLFEHAVWTLVGSGGGGGAPSRAQVIAVLYVEHASAPTITDDDVAGYIVGTRWLTPTNEYVCIDDATGAAVWKTTTSTSSVTASDVSAAAHAELTGTTVQSQLTSIGDIIATLVLTVSITVNGTMNYRDMNSIYGPEIDDASYTLTKEALS
jgi:hypothetical protein